MSNKSNYCKYGHYKHGDNLKLRVRTIKAETRNRKKDLTYTERICRTCLDRQRRAYDARVSESRSV